jgi:DNA-binding transcriptional LysR family regulator
MVAAGYGTTLIPGLAAGAAQDAGIVLRPLAAKAGRTVRIAWRAHFPGRRRSRPWARSSPTACAPSPRAGSATAP